MSSAELEQMIRRVVREERGDGSGAESELITIAQAAALVMCGVTTIRTWMKAGTLKRYGEGRVVRVNRRQVLEVMANPSRAEAKDPEEMARQIVRGLR